MATTYAQLLAQVRLKLREPAAKFWSDPELLDLALAGTRDLWRRINDLYQAYFITIDVTNVSLAASSSALAGVPADLYRLVAIEPRVLGELNPNPGLIFKPRDYNHPDMIAARGQSPVEPRDTTIFYTLMTAGAPVAAPVIRVAPQVTSAVLLAVVYNQTLGTLTAFSTNPIPGESDNALVAWTMAYARAKEREDRAPDPEWLAVYGIEKTNLIQQLTPRQIQEPTITEGVFESLWPDGQ